MMRKNNKPIIVLGMHRSGTSLLANILQELGVFIGKDLNIHYESKNFLELNEFILAVAHTYWDYPLPIKNLFNDDITKENIIKYLQDKIYSANFKKDFFGKKNVFLKKDMSLIWGWKEPRTTITFPFWHTIFPQAKFIFIYRNGIDVAASLYNREKNRIGNINSIPYSLRCLNIERAFKLWEEYNEIFFEYKHLIRAENLISFSYEEFLCEPKERINQISNFINLHIDENRIRKIVENITSENAFKLLKNDTLMEIYMRKKNNEMMKILNYNNINS